MVRTYLLWSRRLKVTTATAPRFAERNFYGMQFCFYQNSQALSGYTISIYELPIADIESGRTLNRASFQDRLEMVISTIDRQQIFRPPCHSFSHIDTN